MVMIGDPARTHNPTLKPLFFSVFGELLLRVLMFSLPAFIPALKLQRQELTYKGMHVGQTFCCDPKPQRLTRS